MTANRFAAAMLDSMNRHNQTIAESTKAGMIELIDHCGNRYNLHVWVQPGGRTHYLLECNRTPQALGNIFRAALPADASAFDDNDDFLRAVLHTAHVAASARLT